VTSASLSLATLEASSDLHALLRRIDPATFREDIEADARAQLARIVDRVRTLCESSKKDSSSTNVALQSKLSQLEAALVRAQQHESESARAFWATFQREVHPAYEALAAWLRSCALPAPSLRPTNYSRNLFHVSSALTALLVIAMAPSQAYIIAAAAAICLPAWTLEWARRRSPKLNERLMAFFGKVAHVHERHRVNSSTWYGTALLILALTTQPAVSAIAVMVLGVGDPVAAIVGRRFGRTRLRAGRSLQGSLGFFAAAAAVSFVVALLLLPASIPVQVGVAVVAALTGAVVEIFSTHIDDNLTIPLAVALTVSVTLALL
jgi:dolichol kinase